MVMFEETDGTARNLAASQKTSSPWQVHSAGTSPATAGEQEHGWGKRWDICYDGTWRKEIWYKRPMSTKTDVAGSLHIIKAHVFTALI